MSLGRNRTGPLIILTVFIMSLFTAPAHAGQAVPPSALLQQSSGDFVAISESTVADFNTGTPGLCSVVETEDGELILAPTAGGEFSGTSLPAGWESSEWLSGGGSTVAGGSLSVDRAGEHGGELWAGALYRIRGYIW